MRNFKLILCSICLFLCSLFSLQAQQFSLQGNAYQLDPNTYKMTEYLNSQAGMVTNYYPLDLTQNFELNFQLNFGTDYGGADGLAFVMTNSCNPTLTNGSGLGVQGIPNSIISEFDTYYNGYPSDDIYYDHTTLYKNGFLDAAHNISDGTTTPVCMLPSCFFVKDGNWYDVKIIWQYISATSQKISVYFNGNLRNTGTGNHILNSFLGSTNVFWSITASTGGAMNLQQFRYTDSNNSFSLCKNTSITLTAPTLGTNYSWTNIASTTNTATYTPTTNQTISCNYKDYCAIVRTVNFNLTVYESLDFTVENPTPICSGDTAFFTVNGIATNKVTYSLNGSIIQMGTIPSNGKLVIPITNAQTSQRLTIIKIENSHNCSSTPATNYTIFVNKPVTSPILYN